jgi:glycosyltransferase involved in cell wall biosynthesis
VCVDDGSTDESGIILDEYAAKDGRIRLFYQSNGGAAAARNRALKEAQGEYICFLDGDDIFHRDFLEKANEIFKKEQAVDFLRFRMKRFKEKIELEKMGVSESAEYSVVSDSDIPEWGFENLICEGNPGPCILKRSLSGVFPVGVKLSEDTVFILEALSRAEKIVQSEFAGYYYRDSDNSATKKKSPSEERLIFFDAFEKMINLFSSHTQGMSRMGWFNLIVWALNPCDTTYAKDIHKMFKALVEKRKIFYKDLQKHWRISFLAYYYCKSTFLIHLTHWAIRLVLFCRNAVRGLLV